MYLTVGINASAGAFIICAIGFAASNIMILNAIPRIPNTLRLVPIV